MYYLLTVYICVYLQSSIGNWDDGLNRWSVESPLYPPGNTPDVPSLSASTHTPLLDDTVLSSTTYDLFENQSIWSLSNSDSSTLLSWAQLKSESPQGKTEWTPPPTRLYWNDFGLLILENDFNLSQWNWVDIIII